MRESIGATWIFGIVIVFIIIFTGYLAFSVNYAKAFTMKDEIIDVLEKYNGPGETKTDGNKEYSIVSKYIKDKMYEISYHSDGSCYNVAKYLYQNTVEDEPTKKRLLGGKEEYLYVFRNSYDTFKNDRFNYCIFREEQTFAGGEKPDANLSFSTYRVVVFFSINVNILKMFSNYYVTGETKEIAYPVDGFLRRP